MSKSLGEMLQKQIDKYNKNFDNNLKLINEVRQKQNLKENEPIDLFSAFKQQEVEE